MAAAPAGPGEWSCPHGGRWVRWEGGWMQVAAPMIFFEEPGIAEPACKCEPPFPGQKQAVPEVRAVPDDEITGEEDEIPGDESWDGDWDEAEDP